MSDKNVSIITHRLTNISVKRIKIQLLTLKACLPETGRWTTSTYKEFFFLGI